MQILTGRVFWQRMTFLLTEAHQFNFILYSILESIIFTPMIQSSNTSHSQTLKNWSTHISLTIGKQNFGLTLMAIAQIIWPLSFLYPSEQNINPFQTNLLRSLFTVISHYFIIRYFGYDNHLQSHHNFKYVIRRNIIICCHQFALTGMFFVLPFPIVFILNNSCALFVFPIDYLVYGVKINKQQILGIALGFAGVLLTVNGQFITNLLNPGFQMETDFKYYVTNDPYTKLLASIGFIFVNFARAYALCITKQLRGVNGIELSFQFGTCLLFYCGVFYPLFVEKSSPFDKLGWNLLLSALPQTIVQILFMSALILSKNTGLTNLLSFITIAVGYFISLFRFHEKLNIICLTGVAMILYGLIKTLVSRQEHQK